MVAVDVKTGELLSFWSYPSYDPNLLAGLDKATVDRNWALLNLADGAPLRPHQYQDRYFPGSTFKVVTGSTGLQTGKVTPEQPVYPVERSYTPPRHDTSHQQLRGELVRRRASSTSCGCRATPRSPAWAPRPSVPPT